MPSRSIRSAGWILVRQIEVVRIFGAKSVPQRIGATIVLDLHPRALSTTLVWHVDPLATIPSKSCAAIVA